MNETKAKILQAAEELISEKGISRNHDSSDCQKSRSVRLSAYQYFKDKEDLVFAVAAQRLEHSSSELQEQLQGIIDPRSNSAELYGTTSEYHDRYQDYIRNLIFECRSNRDFYYSFAYAFVKKHAQLTLQILNRESRGGDFQK